MLFSNLFSTREINMTFFLIIMILRVLLMINQFQIRASNIVSSFFRVYYFYIDNYEKKIKQKQMKIL
jgi:hypothetical protein